MPLKSEYVLVFIYGTLKKGQSNHSLMRELNATCISENSYISENTYIILTQYGVPYLVNTDVKRALHISGELYLVHSAKFPSLVQFERGYIPTEVKVESPLSDSLTAVTFVSARDITENARHTYNYKG